MKRICRLFSISLVLYAMSYSASSQGQTVHPYLGVSSSFGGVTIRTWSGAGVEIGARLGMFHLGFEYGSYGPIEMQLDPPLAWGFLTSSEIYYGIDLGVIIKKNFWIGADILYSRPAKPTSTAPTDGVWSAGVYDRSWLNVGPDLRLECWDHALFNCAYTIRRGLKAGCAFVF